MPFLGEIVAAVAVPVAALGESQLLNLIPGLKAQQESTWRFRSKDGSHLRTSKSERLLTRLMKVHRYEDDSFKGGEHLGEHLLKVKCRFIP
jgi:hypothetical protein